MIVNQSRVAAALPNYELGHQLGSGTFGLVLAGEHRRLGRPVAIKVMLAEGPEGVSVDFSAEARALAGLDHPHVVRAYDYIEAEGLCLVVMELLAGGTLTRRRGTLSGEQACAVGLAVAAALEHAHGRGILHRDIKADNILFAADGTVKVTDFGIAKLFEGSAATASGMSGTPMYMAPEQIEGGRLSPATDLYALGIVLYQLLTGIPPFNPKQPVNRLWCQHLNDPPPPMKGVPGPVAEVVLRALAKKPVDRQPNGHAFAADLFSAAERTYGPGWLKRTGMPLKLSDEIRSNLPAAPAVDSASPTLRSPNYSVRALCVAFAVFLFSGGVAVGRFTASHGADTSTIRDSGRQPAVAAGVTELPSPTIGHNPLPSQVRVSIYNGTHVSGNASLATSRLAALGFRVRNAGNDSSLEHVATHIFYGPGEEAAARTLANAVPGATLLADSTVVDLKLVLGSDFSGIATPSATKR